MADELLAGRERVAVWAQPRLETALASAPTGPLLEVAHDPEDPAVVVYTSGTTGPPKRCPASPGTGVEHRLARIGLGVGRGRHGRPRPAAVPRPRAGDRGRRAAAPRRDDALRRPDDGFRTGDLATRRADGYVRIVGRRATDLIMTGGFKVGAGEIEMVVAWVVKDPGETVEEAEPIDLVAATLVPYKRPRKINFIDDLPRNALGKLQKKRLPTTT